MHSIISVSTPNTVATKARLIRRAHNVYTFVSSPSLSERLIYYQNTKPETVQ
jgi:hypothetical protein